MYSDIAAQGLSAHVHQWASLISFSQNRLVYEKSALPKRSKCLDWGTGNGHFSYFLLRSEMLVDGYSIDEPPAFLTSNPNFQFTRGSDPVTLPYDAGAFDAVFSIGVLEHVHDRGGSQRASILEIQRILKRGGKLFIFHLPNEYSWIERARMLSNAIGITSNPHSVHTLRFTKRSFMKLLQGTSFQLNDCGRYHFLPRNAFNLLPFKNSPMACKIVDATDSALSSALSWYSQNWYFILTKS